MELTGILTIGGGIIAYILGKRYLDKRKEGHQGAKAVTETIKSFSETEVRYPTSHETTTPKTLGGKPHLYNEADHTRGRFLAFIRTPTDKEDERVLKGGFYRIRYLKDVKKFWFYKTSQEETTPCVFRPGIDTLMKNPGEEPGVPPEGLIVVKRSMDGHRVATTGADRYRIQLLNERAKNSILADSMLNLLDKDRLANLPLSGEELSSELEKLLKRTKKVHDAASGRSNSDHNFGSPYGNELFGNEPPSTPSTNEGLWNFEG